MTDKAVRYYGVAKPTARSGWVEYEVTRDTAGRLRQVETGTVYRTSREAMDSIGRKNVDLSRAVVR